MNKQNGLYGKSDDTSLSSNDESIDILRNTGCLYFVIRGACNEKIQQDTALKNSCYALLYSS